MAFLPKDGKWKVNGTPIPTPGKDTQISHTNVVSSDSGRTQDGKMHMTWIRTDITTIALKYPYLSGDEKNLLEKLMQGKEFTFTYWDNGEKEINAYVGESSYSIHTYALKANQGGIYKDFSMNVIEM